MPGKQHYRWCFTLTDYTTQEYESLKEKLINENNVKYAIIGKEVGENETPYLEGYISLYTKKPLSMMKGMICSRACVEGSICTFKQNYEYCAKKGNFEEFGCKKQEQFEKTEFVKFDDAECNEAQCQQRKMARLKYKGTNARSCNEEHSIEMEWEAARKRVQYAFKDRLPVCIALNPKYSIVIGFSYLNCNDRVRRAALEFAHNHYILSSNMDSASNGLHLMFTFPGRKTSKAHFIDELRQRGELNNVYTDYFRMPMVYGGQLSNGVQEMVPDLFKIPSLQKVWVIGYGSQQQDLPATKKGIYTVRRVSLIKCPLFRVTEMKCIQQHLKDGSNQAVGVSYPSHFLLFERNSY